MSLPENLPGGQTPIPDDVTQPQTSEYQRQRDRLRYVLDDLKEQRSFGIEWILRLFLAAVQFIYPALLIRTVFGKFGFIYERVGVELYVLTKFAFFALAIIYEGFESPVAVVLVIYLLSETVFYLASMIFLADLYAPPVSWRRSVLLLLINYLEITLAFAVLYLTQHVPEESSSGPFRGVFYSFITSTGIGYSPLYTSTITGKVIVVCQICVMGIFLILVAQYVTNSLEALKKPSQIEK